MGVVLDNLDGSIALVACREIRRRSAALNVCAVQIADLDSLVRGARWGSAQRHSAGLPFRHPSPAVPESRHRADITGDPKRRRVKVVDISVRPLMK